MPQTTVRAARLVAALLIAAPSLACAQRPADVHAHGAASAPRPTPAARAQLDSARRAVEPLATPAAARAAGYIPVFGNVPFQGEHYVKYDLVVRDSFDLLRPSVLMFAPIEGESRLVGIAYAYQHPRGAPPPGGFDGAADVWHSHDELSRDPGKHIVMMHAWFVDAPDGPFARHNPWLPFHAAGLTPPGASALADSARADSVRRFALALAIATQPPQLLQRVERRLEPAAADSAARAREALAAALPRLRDAQRAGDTATYARLAAEATAHGQSLVGTYRESIRIPLLRTLFDQLIAEISSPGGSHKH